MMNIEVCCKKKIAHMITAEKINSENKFVINFCDSCINQQSFCWIDHHSTRCVDCAEFERTKQKCDVNKSNFKFIFNQSIFFVSSSTSFKTMSIATSFKKRLIWFRKNSMKINWRINQNMIFTIFFSFSKISRSCRFSSFSFFKISYSCSNRFSLVIICCICREIFFVIDRLVCCVLDCLVFYVLDCLVCYVFDCFVCRVLDFCVHHDVKQHFSIVNVIFFIFFIFDVDVRVIFLFIRFLLIAQCSSRREWTIQKNEILNEWSINNNVRNNFAIEITNCRIENSFEQND